MKKIIAGQIILLLLTVGIGVILKGDLQSNVRIVHKIFGLLSVLTGIAVLASAFLNHQPSAVKILSVTTFLFTLLAGVGGILTQTGGNYQAAFYQMTFSATIALILGSINFFKANSR